MQHHQVPPVYNPNRLLDAVLQHLQLDSDNALSRQLKVAENILIAIRRGCMPVGASMLLWLHELTGISIHELRNLMGDRRAKCRLNYVINSGM